MAELTDNQRDEYNKNPNHCPYCKSQDIMGGLLKNDDMTAWQSVFCNTCNKNWKDIYSFDGIETDR